MSINKVILVGNVGKDPEVRYLEGGTAVCKFSLATSETYKNKDGEKVSSTEWHNIVLWRGLAEIAEKYIKKGMQLYIEGRIKTRSYTDQEGKVKYISEIVGDNFQMLGKKSDEPQSSMHTESSAARPEGNSENPSNSNSGDDFVSNSPGTDDLPF
jgi:single-strand DNA-binding protein